MTMNWIRGPQGFRWVIFGQEANHDETWMDLFGGGELFTSAQYDQVSSTMDSPEPTDVLFSYRPWKTFINEMMNDEWEIAEWVFTTSDGFSSYEEWDEEDPVQPLEDWWKKRVAEVNEHFDSPNWKIVAEIRFDDGDVATQQLFIQK